MVKLKLIQVIDKEEICKFEAEGEELSVVYNGEYEPGDKWYVESDSEFIKLRLDKTMAESIIYTPSGTLDFKIPFEYERKALYGDEAFSGDSHEVTASSASEEEAYARREISLNSHDRYKTYFCFPHAVANVVTKEHPALCERNAIDGVIRNEKHGVYPHNSWGGGKREDLIFEVQFGRRVKIDSMVLFIRAEFPHDTYWTDGTVEFDDGTLVPIKIEGVMEGQKYEFEPHESSFIRLKNLKQKRLPDGSLSFAALSQIQVFGQYIK